MFLILETPALLVSWAVGKASRGMLIPCHTGGVFMCPLDAHWSPPREIAFCSSSRFSSGRFICGQHSHCQVPLAFSGTVLSLPPHLPPLGGTGDLQDSSLVSLETETASSPTRFVFGERAVLCVILLSPVVAPVLNQCDGRPF